MIGKRRKPSGRWSEEYKRQIVAEAEASAEPIASIARRYGVTPKRLYF